MRQERVWVEIDLGAVRRNLQRIQQLVGPSVRVMTVLKADAYGHGAVPVARAAVEAGAAAIGVGDSTEGLELREAGIRVPILILGAIVDGEIEAVVRHGISTCIHSRDRLARLAREAERQGKRATAHLMVDTGMGRLGVRPESVLALLAAIHAEPAVVLGGIATHFSTPADPEFTAEQEARFRAVLSDAARAELAVGLRHAAATGALLRYPSTHLDLVRPGLSLYGADPGGTGVRERGFEPALALRSQVIYLKDVPAGTPIGYGRLHVTEAPTRIATVPAGYDDGLPLAISNHGRALVAGEPAPLVGRISMDYCMLDVGAIPGVEVGSEVTFVGRDGAEELRLEELARAAGTLPYAITCGLGRRVRRLYQAATPAYLATG